MNNVSSNRIAGLGSGSTSDRLLNWNPPRRDPPDLILARQALDCRRLDEAERHLQRALDTAPNCAEVRTLMGLLHERLGEHHAAYRCYRLALILDPHDTTAGDGLHRYCHRFGYDPDNKAINPAATHSA
jgi:tetratricopeptide (TPR) repeat protein